MIIDALLQFDSANTITSTAVSTNIINLGAQEDIGIGVEALKLLILTGNAFTTTNAATLNIQFQCSTISTGSFSTVVETGVMSAGVLTAARKLFEIDLPRNQLTQYLQLNYVVGTGIFSSGTISYSGIVLDRNDYAYYPSGIAIFN